MALSRLFACAKQFVSGHFFVETIKMKIYLLEDSEVYSKALSRILETCTPFMITNSFSKGHDLLTFLESDKSSETIPDLILLDLYLPDISGWEVLESMEANQIDSPVIIISQSSSPSDVKRSNSYSNVVGYYNKGAFPADLIDMINRLYSN